MHNIFYLNNVETFVWPLEEQYIEAKGNKNFYPPIMKHVNNLCALKIRLLDEYSHQSIISIDDLAMGYLAGLDKDRSSRPTSQPR